MSQVKAVRVEIEFDDGMITRLSGEEAERHRQACNNMCVMASVHGSEFPKFDWETFLRETPEQRQSRECPKSTLPEADTTPWEDETISAIAALAESAKWNDSSVTLALSSEGKHGPHEIECKSIEELKETLGEEAATVWYANVPNDGGEAAFDLDEEWVYEMLDTEPWATELKKLGWER